MEAVKNRATVRAPRREMGTVTRKLKVRTESANICRSILVLSLGFPGI